ncbi:hypothetical protein ACT80S_18475 [Ramlibacter sp. MAHUQ-53]|uniref:hypothetical protein n=1 Tax=unclassified Ramlibacter TaxID=2617605 RepID=UPI003629EE70
MTANEDSTPLRVCKGCNQALAANLENFPPHKMGKFGLYTHCRPCKKAKDAERRARPDQQARQKAWRDANKDKIRQYNEAYRAAGYRSTDDVRAWVAANPERSKQINREKVARWRRTLPWYSLKTRISSRIYTMLKAGGGSKARQSTEEILGYSLSELKSHIERQFTRGMTWEKFMSGEIHLDHIIPVSHFKADSIGSDDFRACWAMANLRPMWASENIAKGDSITTLL